MLVRRRIDQLGGDPHPIARAHHGAFDDGIDVEYFGDLGLEAAERSLFASAGETSFWTLKESFPS